MRRHGCARWRAAPGVSSPRPWHRSGSSSISIRFLAGGTAFADNRAANLPTLTPRQAEILSLLAEGHGNKEIRHRLGIAERTVRAHLTELFQVLGAHSRMQALIRAREFGLIE